MDLYHFTYPKYLKSILRHGLRPANGSASGSVNMTGGKKVVWLTTRPSLVPSRRAREMMLLRGISVKSGGSNLPHATVCLRVRLATHDKALKHWLRWARKQRGRDLIPPLRVYERISAVLALGLSSHVVAHREGRRHRRQIRFDNRC
jgi:hypothetical protein